MSVLKIISDTNCSVRCDFQEVGNIQVGEPFRLQLKKGCYILEFLVEDLVICSRDYIIETNDVEPLLRLNIKEQAEKKIRERQYGFVFSEDGRTIIDCNKSFEGELIVPEGVEHIAALAFDSCIASSIHIPNSVKSIGYDAFASCYYLTSITIPNSVTSIVDGAFKWCCGLTTIVVEEGNTKYDSRNKCNAIIETSSNTLIVGCKNTTIPNSVTSIGNNAFDGCHYLTSITIPNSVTNIGSWAFAGCSSLTSVTIPNSMKSIGDDAFDGCSGLTSVTIPNSVTSIGNWAFNGCSSLTSVTIPNSVKSIGDDAFDGCSGLTTIVVEEGNTKYDSRNKSNAIIETSSNTLIVGCKNTTIPNSVTSIGNNAFAGCHYLTSITIPNSVTSIGSWAFYDCSSMTSVTIPNSVTSIGRGAFHDCNGMTSVTIPNSVTSIGDDAFYSCSGLTSVSILNSVTSMGDCVFSECNNLKEIIIPKGTRYKFEEMLPGQKDELVEQKQMAKKGDKG